MKPKDFLAQVRAASRSRAKHPDLALAEACRHASSAHYAGLLQALSEQSRRNGDGTLAAQRLLPPWQLLGPLP